MSLGRSTFKYIVSVLMLLVISFDVMAQSESFISRISFGAKYGLNINNSSYLNSRFDAFTFTGGSRSKSILNQETRSGQQVGLVLSTKISDRLAIIGEFNWITVNAYFDYDTIEYSSGRRVIEKTINGAFEQKRTFKQFPLIVEYSFKGIFRPFILAGIFFNNVGKGKGKWSYEQVQYGVVSNQEIEWLPDSIVSKITRQATFGTNFNIGYIVGAGIRKEAFKDIDFSISARYQSGFRNDHYLPSIRRRTILFDFTIFLKNING